jgi:RNA polymerase sigma-70 factor, ECF subfamily
VGARSRPKRFERLSDAQLLLEESDRAFGELYERHAEAVLRYFARRTGSADTAADLVAETFAAAFVSRHRFRDLGSPARAWLYSIARRQLSHYVRHEAVANRYRRRLGLEPVNLTEEDYERIEALADLRTLRDQLRQAVGELPEAQAEAVRLRIVEDLPYSAVALQLNCSEGAARVRVTRALARLADHLEGT